MKTAIAIITYVRDAYFDETLSSIFKQKIDGHSIHEYFDLYVFQDGLPDGAEEAEKESHRKIAQICQSKEQQLTFIPQPKNLGIALHFDYVERFLFLEKGYEFAGFFEDDLVLAPGHLKAFKLLQEKFQHDPRVGMISAASANYKRPLSEQESKLHDYEQMGHNWAFGLSRDFWLRRQPLIDEYLNIVRETPYLKRSHQKVYDWLKKRGMQPRASSQDYIKQCATTAVGGVRIATCANYGFYIGRSGSHFTPELYEKLNFGDTVICDREINEAGALSDDQYREIYNQQIAAFVLDKLDAPTSVEDVKSCYRMLLGREVENATVIEQNLKKTRRNLLTSLLLSDEFLSSPSSRKMILDIHRKLSKSLAPDTPKT